MLEDGKSSETSTFVNKSNYNRHGPRRTPYHKVPKIRERRPPVMACPLVLIFATRYKLVVDLP